MTDRVYQMSDDYQQALASLLEVIKVRDALAASIKTAPPAKRRERQELLAQLEKQIEKSEAALADEYELYQQKCRAEEEYDEIMKAVTEKAEMIFIYFKHHLPDKLEEVKATLFKGWTPEKIEDFYDRVAIREATQLEEILAGNKEPINKLSDKDNKANK